MKYLKQLALIISIYLAGEAISHLSGLPVPGNIFGLLLLLILLMSGVVRETQIRETADFLLEHLSLFLIVPGVNLLRDFRLLEGYVAKTLIMIFVSVLLVLIITALVSKYLIRLTGEDAS